MKTWKKQLAVLVIGGCLLLGLTACGSSEAAEPIEDDSVSYAEDIQKRKDAEAAAQPEEQVEKITVESDAEDEEESDQTPDAEGETDEQESDQWDDSQDGEARNEISMTEAEESVKSQFGTEDENGNAYEYTLDSIATVGDREYYVYRMSWAADEQDAQAYKQTLNYIFVATDGSTIHTGNVDEDGYDIDYSS
ncbi:MAG: hypothetical protein ACI4PM_00060 [Butyricicoccus sp.]